MNELASTRSVVNFNISNCEKLSSPIKSQAYLHFFKWHYIIFAIKYYRGHRISKVIFKIAICRWTYSVWYSFYLVAIVYKTANLLRIAWKMNFYLMELNMFKKIVSVFTFAFLRLWFLLYNCFLNNSLPLWVIWCYILYASHFIFYLIFQD